MKNPIPLLALLLGVWIVGGALLWKKTCCAPGITGLSVLDGATTVAANSTNNFYFAFSGDQPMGIETVEKDMQDIISYLNENPNKYLTIVGRYTNEEKNNTSFGNLGLGRAHGVRNYLAGLGASTDQLFTGSKLMDELSFSDDKTYEAIDWSFTDVNYEISFIDTVGNYNNVFADDFLFAKSNFDYSTPLSSGLKTTIGKTAEYLKKSGDRSMLITGYYMEDEENTGVLPDLGLSRANAIKKAFTDLGVPANLINIASEKKDLFFFKGLSSAATYSFSATAKGNDRLAEVEQRLKAKPLILYFNTNEANLNLSTEQRNYMADVIYYLDNKKGATVKSVGHTDNVGDDTLNQRLSRKRAEFVKNYLTRNNINGSQITISGKGPSQPTATNDTAEGRAKNRRVEISIDK